MKLWKLGWMLVVTSVVLAGCGIGDNDDIGTDAGTSADTDAGMGTDAGTTRCWWDADCGSGQRCDTGTGQCKAQSLSCTDDSGCFASEICHPTAKVCVRTCTGSFDCPVSAKTCEAVNSTYTQKVCKCSTDTLCNVERATADLVCSNVERVCMPKCTTDAQCVTGKICNTATGYCEAKVTDTNGSPCSGTGQSTCNYGTYCDSRVCSPLPAPTCPNYENFTNKSSLGTTGPILFGARVVGVTSDTSYCPASSPTRVRIMLSAYSSVPFPTTKDALGGFFRVSVAGSVVDAPQLVDSAAGNYIVMGTNWERADIIVNLCASSSSVTLSTAFYFTNGNFLCYQANW
ncbi:hypothetical protein ATI61_11060 [Archangium gephyra]|uniref:CHP n=1 Tax=Archangium gephyra TaxID=48 RepID=A0AAC8THF6_9BACT|nr:hypothetical protein [Archangium gephyra]AKJ06197.1 CHP [Archangium gephyra]REG27053.1 hypothetical protein ATI61_11060 [Archangium gephyra]